VITPEKRIRTSQRLFNHRKSHSGKLIFRYSEFVDFIQIDKPHADWLYGLIIDYLSFLANLRFVFFSTGDSLLAFAQRFNLKHSAEILMQQL